MGTGQWVWKKGGSLRRGCVAVGVRLLLVLEASLRDAANASAQSLVDLQVVRDRAGNGAGLVQLAGMIDGAKHSTPLPPSTHSATFSFQSISIANFLVLTELCQL